MVPWYRRSLAHKRWSFLFRFLRDRDRPRRPIRIVRQPRGELKIFSGGYHVVVRNRQPVMIWDDYVGFPVARAVVP